MGGFFGITSKKDCMLDVFFGVDYHSHLGTRRAGMAAWDEEIGLQRKIHNICNAPSGPSLSIFLRRCAALPPSDVFPTRIPSPC